MVLHIEILFIINTGEHFSFFQYEYTFTSHCVNMYFSVLQLDI
jgi:hypothetical protein